MHLISENSEAGLARKRAEADARQAVRELAANLMRLAAGAGKPYQVESQAAKLLVACKAYREAAPNYPVSNDLAEELDLTKDLLAADLSNEEEERRHGDELVMTGALRMAAAELLGQTVQAANGRGLMFDGIEIIEQGRERSRVKAQARAPAKPQRSKARASRQSEP